MPTSVSANKELIIFFGVKADSPNSIQVKIGKLIYERPNPNNLEDHAVPRAS